VGFMVDRVAQGQLFFKYVGSAPCSFINQSVTLCNLSSWQHW
jgi:hypothetical protein